MDTPLREHEVFSMGTQLEKSIDAVLLYRKVSDDGCRPHTMLFQAGHNGKGIDKTKVIVSSALLIECHGRQVRLQALNKNGRNALQHLEMQLAKFGHCKRLSLDELHVDYPITPKEVDLESALRAPSPMSALRGILNNWSIQGNTDSKILLTGVFSYDFAAAFEDLPDGQTDTLEFPNFVFWLPDEIVEIDHINQTTSIETLVFGGHTELDPATAQKSRLDELTVTCSEIPRTQQKSPSVAPLSLHPDKFATDIQDEQYESHVSQLKAYIRSGDVFQIVLSRTFQTPCSDPIRSFQNLVQNNPSRYHFFASHPQWTLFGASPETSVRVDAETRTLTITPIAGTRPRGRDNTGKLLQDLDSRYETELRLSEKEVAEHMMLVDLARNDVARVSKPGSRRVHDLLRVERYQHVMHLVSTVEGELKDNYDSLHAYQSSMNMGTLTGAPKVRAMQILKEVEATRRGPYGGAIGVLSSDGEFDTAIVIRSALVKNKMAYVRAGAGLVHDSVPSLEAAETIHKAKAVLQALAN
jgi:anthranilate synthase component I